MVLKHNINDLKRLLIVVLISLPLHETASTNIDCNGKSFHCLNSTHFMICVDLGGGVSSTVDDFVIPCPPTTICKPTNRFECEFPAPIETATEAATFGTTGMTTLQWESINVTATFPTSLEEHLDLRNSTTASPIATTNLEPNQTETFNNKNTETITSVVISEFDVTTESFAIESTSALPNETSNIEPDQAETFNDKNTETITSVVISEFDVTTESFAIESTSALPNETTNIEPNQAETFNDKNTETITSVVISEFDVTTESFAIESTSALPNETTNIEPNQTETLNDKNTDSITSVVKSELDVTTESFAIESTLALPNETTNIEPNQAETFNDKNTETITSVVKSELDVTTVSFAIESTLALPNETTNVEPNQAETFNDKNTETITSVVKSEFGVTTESFAIESILNTTSVTNPAVIISDVKNRTITSVAPEVTTESIFIVTSPFATTSRTNSTEIISDINDGILTSVAQNDLDVTTEYLVTRTMDNTSDTHSIELNHTISSVEQNLTTEGSIVKTTLLYNKTTDMNPTTKVDEISNSVTQKKPDVIEVFTTTSLVLVDVITATTINPTVTEIASAKNTTTEMSMENATMPSSTTNKIIDTRPISISIDNNNGAVTSKVTTGGIAETTVAYDTTYLGFVTETSTRNQTDRLSENNNVTVSNDKLENQDTTTNVPTSVIEYTTISDIDISLNENATYYTTIEMNPVTVSIIITENENITENEVDMKPTEVTEPTITTISDHKLTTTSTAIETTTVDNKPYEGHVTDSISGSTNGIKNTTQFNLSQPTDVTEPTMTTISDHKFTTTFMVIDTTTVVKKPDEVDVTESTNGNKNTTQRSVTDDTMKSVTQNYSELVTLEISTPFNLVNIKTTTEMTPLTPSTTTDWIPETSETVYTVDETYPSETSLPATQLLSVTTEPNINLPTPRVDLPVIDIHSTNNVVATTQYDRTAGGVDMTTNSNAVQVNDILSTTDLPALTIDISSISTIPSNEAGASQNVTTAFSSTDDNFTMSGAKTTREEINKTLYDSTLQSLAPDIEVVTEPYNVLNTNINNVVTEYLDVTMITETNLDSSSVITTEQLNLESSTNPGIITTKTAPVYEFPTVITEDASIATIPDNVFIPTNSVGSDKMLTTIYTENPSMVTTPYIQFQDVTPTTTEVYNIYDILSTPTAKLGEPADMTIDESYQKTNPENKATTVWGLDRPSTQLNVDPTPISEYNETEQSLPDTNQIHTLSTKPSNIETGKNVTNSVTLASSTSDYEQKFVTKVSAITKSMTTATTAVHTSIVSNTNDDDLLSPTELINIDSFTELPVHTTNFQLTYTDVLTTLPTPVNVDIGYEGNMDITTQNVIGLPGTTANQIDENSNIIQLTKNNSLNPITGNIYKTELPAPISVISTNQDIQQNMQKQIEVTNVTTITGSGDANENKTMPNKQLQNESTKPGIPPTMPAAIVAYTAPMTQKDSLTTGISVTEAFPTKITTPNSKLDVSYIDPQSNGFNCKNRENGRYPDMHDCRKFYICNGQQVAVDHCPENTVYSDLKKKCTKNLSHCIRNNEFKCTSDGRFYDYFEQNIYYVCVRNTYTHMYVRFKFQCQKGYHLNKKTVACELNPNVTTVTVPALRESIKATTEKINLKKSMESEYECENEGKFPDTYDCRKYYVCTRILESEEFITKIKYCDSDEIFHPERKRCVDDESYECSRAGFSCKNRASGKYADSDDCGIFYTCYGTHLLAVRRCPQNTVFSDFKKQCTTEISHCVRNKQFLCASDGRFYDYFEENVYHVCVRNTLTNVYVRFKFQCQTGYYLDKATLKCEHSKTLIKQASTDGKFNNKRFKSLSKEGSESKQKSSNDFECEQTGKFSDPNDCRKYFVCTTRNSEEFRRRRKKCDSDEVFHKEKKECVDAESYECL